MRLGTLFPLILRPGRLLIPRYKQWLKSGLCTHIVRILGPALPRPAFEKVLL
jgi:hypothetical protein